MRSIKSSLPNYLYNHIQNSSIAKADAYPVKTYRELVEKIAQLAYFNKDYLLFYRGQGIDFKNKGGSSTIYPKIYRGERLTLTELEIRFDLLNIVSRKLCDAFESNGLIGYKHIKRKRYIQWSIIQHYEVWPTPLLDLTQSLRVACSFAFLSSEKNPFLFVFGLPYLTNRISINSEHDIVNIRLLSVCPPDALRPYFQEGFLAGTDEITTNYYSKDELDFNRRLIAKFKLNDSKKFWNDGFQPIPKEILYPKDDIVEKTCLDLREDIGNEIEPGKLGIFLQIWAELENILINFARDYNIKVFSLLEALSIIKNKNIIPYNLFKSIDKIRRFRNKVIHSPSKINIFDLSNAIEETKIILNQIKGIN